MMIIAIVMFVWQQIAHMENSKDEQLVSLNKSEFNSAFLAYQKDLMYGTDVLSCLNKAQNNNQRYVYNNYYGTDTANIGAEVREEYFIDVIVTLNNPLSERLIVNQRNSKGKMSPVLSVTDAEAYKVKLFKYDSEKSHFDMPNVTYYYFEKGILKKESKSYAQVMWEGTAMSDNLSIYDLLTTPEKLETIFKAGEYHLLQADSGSNDGDVGNYSSTLAGKKKSARLSALLSTINKMEITVENKDTDTYSDWYSATWRTAAYDFKTRKFECTGVDYNQNTGYVNRIYFNEK